jgi:hypothetical protein
MFRNQKLYKFMNSTSGESHRCIPSPQKNLRWFVTGEGVSGEGGAGISLWYPRPGIPPHLRQGTDYITETCSHIYITGRSHAPPFSICQSSVRREGGMEKQVISKNLVLFIFSFMLKRHKSLSC